MTADISVSVVSFNTRPELTACLESLLRHKGLLELEVFVVDNASSDGSADVIEKNFPSIHLIRNTQNRYFAAAHNQAFALSVAPYFLLLNSDVVINDDILMRMKNILDQDKTVAAVSSALYHETLSIQPTCSKHYSYALAWINFTLLGKVLRAVGKRKNQEAFYCDWDRRSSRIVDVAPDSFLLVRRSALQKAGGLYDESMRLYFTENDLCMRLQKQGGGVYFLAEGQTVHLESVSVRKLPSATIASIYVEDIFNYFKKYRGFFLALFLRSAILLTGIILRLAQRIFPGAIKQNLVHGIPRVGSR